MKGTDIQSVLEAIELEDNWVNSITGIKDKDQKLFPDDFILHEKTTLLTGRILDTFRD